MRRASIIAWITAFWLVLFFRPGPVSSARTEKPVLHGRNWVAITGKPLAATAGARIFLAGGNAVDASCAMLAAVCTMYDVLSWGGETQALIFNPRTGKVIGVNALGVAPSGATPDFFMSKGYVVPPAYGPLAAVTPGTPGGLIIMLAEFGTMSLEQVLAPAMEMAQGYPVEKEFVDRLTGKRNLDMILSWPDSKRVFLPHENDSPPEPGEVFSQPDLLDTLRKLVEAERQALAGGRSRKEALQAAYDRFYRGDIGRELVRGVKELGGMMTAEDLESWRVHFEEPVVTDYKGISVAKLTSWVQGPVMLQMLNMLENLDLKSMGHNSAAYIHALYQVMNLAFADRDFYYGDPYYPPQEPIRGLLSKEYARERLKLINPERNDPDAGPGDPYPFQGEANPFRRVLDGWHKTRRMVKDDTNGSAAAALESSFFTGTTSIQAADKEGWVVSVTPSGGWVPCVIAGRTGIGLSQRAQSFVLDEAENPFNVIVPGKRPRATLTPGLALKEGRPFLSFAVQGGDTQDQNLLQFFLNIVEFGMNVQEACEAPNITSYQMRDSFDLHESAPGKLDIHESVPPEVRERLTAMGYRLSVKRRTSGPINAIYFDRKHGTFWGGSSNHGEDYGIAW
ncbi:MAG: gamma-glutamyltransferase [Candidatus Aminicenantes bacterium RBG_13_63_10]|nr:MAG: gamma-glutamyltransferase [Candidatus Aminicenantes bacterium RBG_13_63_10]